MPAPARPKASAGGSRAPPVTPMSERQQMALLMQMTSQATDSGSCSPSSTSRPRERNERGETPLHLAAIKGDAEQVCKLLLHRTDPNVADFAGWTPLHEACNHGWYEVAFKLVQAGANVNARGLDNDTPLHDAAINGHLRLVKMLIENGADVNIKNSKGKAPLDVAASPTVVNVMLNPNFPVTGSQDPSAQANQPQEPINMPHLCQIGQETVQDIVSRTLETCLTLKTIQPPVSCTNATSNAKKEKIQELLRTTRLLFKRLRLIYEKCDETEYVNAEMLIPFKDTEAINKERTNSEQYKIACEERNKIKELVVEKNRQLREVLDLLGRTVWEINTALCMRRS